MMRSKFSCFCLLFAMIMLLLFAGVPAWGLDVIKSPPQIEAIGSPPPATVAIMASLTTFEFYVPMVTAGIATAPAATSSIIGYTLNDKPSRIGSEANLLFRNYATDNLRHVACRGATIRAV